MFNIFKRKKKTEEPSGVRPEYPSGRGRMITPVHEVEALASRGVPEPEIIRTLRNEGYSTEEIDKAMKEALRSRVTGPPAAEPSPSPQNPPIPHPGSDIPEIPPAEPPPVQAKSPSIHPTESIPTGESFFRRPSTPLPPPPPKPVTPSKEEGISRKEVEELVEVIIDEKMRKFHEREKEIENRFRQMDRKIDLLKEEIDKLRYEKTNELKGIESKIDSYSKQIDELGGRLESMEKALKDSLSPMLESLRSLSETIKILKEKEKSGRI